MYTRKKLPTTQYELSKGEPDKAFGRSNDMRRDDDTYNDLKIGLHDLDFSIKWYFDNTIKPKVNDFGRDLDVPVMYGSPEKWKNIQEDGYLRDISGKIMKPIISYKRTGVAKNRELGTKVDANYPRSGWHSSGWHRSGWHRSGRHRSGWHRAGRHGCRHLHH